MGLMYGSCMLVGEDSLMPNAGKTVLELMSYFAY
jgi:hypothetical protein